MRRAASASRLIGYARVSTEDQATDPQIEALRAAGCSTIFQDKASGAQRSRPELGRALSALKRGDVLVVARLDRLARSLSHLLEIVEDLEDREIGFRSLGDPIDTTSPQGRLTLQILGAVAEFERQLIRERTRSGLASARAEGRRGGNPTLSAEDPNGRRRLARARDEARSDKVFEAIDEIAPLVRQLRPGASWDRIAQILTIRSVTRPWDARPWTRDSLIRACKRLVKDGFLPAEVMERGPRGAENDGLVELVAAVWSALPSPSLSACARHLQAQHVLTPRGGFRWSASSVRNLLKRARERGLVGEFPAA